MGYSEEQIHIAFAKVSETSRNKESSSLWFAILFHLRLDRVESIHSDSYHFAGKECPATSRTYTSADVGMLFFLASEQVTKRHAPSLLLAVICSISAVLFLLLALYSGKVDFIAKGSDRTEYSSHGAQLNVGSSSSDSALGSFNLRACVTSVCNTLFIWDTVLFAFGSCILSLL